MMFKKTLILGLGFRSFQPSTVFFFSRSFGEKRWDGIPRRCNNCDVCRTCGIVADFVSHGWSSQRANGKKPLKMIVSNVGISGIPGGIPFSSASR